uniref:Uncharacterized protein n=1 Tax=Arundo donax TaxID=35708 RepID=A0A0A9F782_ARUDO
MHTLIASSLHEHNSGSPVDGCREYFLRKKGASLFRAIISVILDCMDSLKGRKPCSIG